MTSNVSLSYPNRIDESTLVPANSANWTTELPLINAQNHVLKKVARTVTGVNAAGDSISVTFGIVLPKYREIGCIAIANHNLTTNATIRFEGFYNDDYTDKKFDNGINYFAYTRLYAPESGFYLFENPEWWYGTIEESQLLSYTPLSSYYPDTNKVCKSIRVTITDTLNPDDYIQFGRVFLGRTVEPKYNPEYGDLQQGYVDLTEIQRAIDNTKYFYIKPKMRTVSCIFKHLDKDEAYLGFYDAQREVGISGELLYAYSKPEYIGNINMTYDKAFYARNFLCNFSELNPIDNPYINGYATTIKLEEIV
jgi:hypothetical protein